MQHGFLKNEKDGVLWLSVPAFDRTGLCITCFSTRIGGVSSAPLESMNLGFNRGDVRENVFENYKRLGLAAGFDSEKLVAFSQIHGDGVCVATEKDAGECYLSEKRKFDAVVTNVSGLPIATYHADCVPIFFLDPIKRAIGVAHAGWRGTAKRCPAAAIRAMVENYGCDVKNILAAIGPSIGKCCFETDGDVPEAMLESFGDVATPHIEDVGNGRYRVSLSGLNLETLRECGISNDNITVDESCTCCNNSLFWSHRATAGIRGTMAAVISLTGADK